MVVSLILIDASSRNKHPALPPVQVKENLAKYFCSD